LTFKDHFSTQAGQYTQFRPHYPRAVFEFLATLPAKTERAWDCGTGNGQAAVALAEFFSEVVATDASAEQIAHAEPHPRVRYLVTAAEQTPLADGSVDLVAVAQALHWFDLEPFYAEVRRVACHGGIVAVWGYEMATVTPEIDRVVQHLYSDVLGSYWPPERRITELRYETIAFPFGELPVPTLKMTAQWKRDDLMGYLGTWSSVQQYIKRHGTDPVPQVSDEVAAAWGLADKTREVTWPLFLRVGRID